MNPAWSYFTTQVQWKSYLQDLLSSNDNALLRAIVCIDNWQTELERKYQESTEENKIGWSKYDAKEMGAIADKVRNGVQLSKGELAKSRNKMKKYWRQLMQISKDQLSAKQRQEQEEKQKLESVQYQQSKDAFARSLEAIRKCSEDGISCGYGMCSKCPLTQGWQLRLNTEVVAK